MTVRQCEDVIAAAVSGASLVPEQPNPKNPAFPQPCPSIALAQALQFELCLCRSIGASAGLACF
jgi:hypothetical protein